MRFGYYYAIVEKLTLGLGRSETLSSVRCSPVEKEPKFLKQYMDTLDILAS